MIFSGLPSSPGEQPAHERLPERSGAAGDEDAVVRQALAMLLRRERSPAYSAVICSHEGTASPVSASKRAAVERAVDDRLVPRLDLASRSSASRSSLSRSNFAIGSEATW